MMQDVLVAKRSVLVMRQAKIKCEKNSVISKNNENEALDNVTKLESQAAKSLNKLHTIRKEKDNAVCRAKRATAKLKTLENDGNSENKRERGKELEELQNKLTRLMNQNACLRGRLENTVVKLNEAKSSAKKFPKRDSNMKDASTINLNTKLQTSRKVCKKTQTQSLDGRSNELPLSTHFHASNEAKGLNGIQSTEERNVS